MTTTQSLQEALKAVTTEAHVAIESSMPVMAADFDRQAYHELLKKLYGFYMPYEAAIEKIIEPFSEVLAWSERRKTRWIESDLTRCGMSPYELQMLPLCAELPLIATAGQLRGVLYVTEGSTLGGTVIKNHLVKKFEDPELPIAFFTSYGPETGKMWRQFLNFLNSEPNKRVTDDAVIAASSTFECLSRWLC